MFLALTLSLATGCGDGDSGSDDPPGAGGTTTGGAPAGGYQPPDNFCTLVTLDEISTAVGEPMEMTQEGTTATGYQCEFRPVQPPALKFLFISWESVNDVSGKPFTDSKPVPEVAPDAESGKNFLGEPNVRWKKGDVYILVSSQGVPDANAKVKIAAQLAKRLP